MIEEHESAEAKDGSNPLGDPVYDEHDASILHDKGGVLILDSMKGDFFQTSPLTPLQAGQCLTAIARFHAAGFQDEEILAKVADRLCEYFGLELTQKARKGRKK